MHSLYSQGPSILGCYSEQLHVQWSIVIGSYPGDEGNFEALEVLLLNVQQRE